MQQSHPAVNDGFGIITIGIILLLIPLFYFFWCYCLKRICEKCGSRAGILIWIPILQIFPMLRAAGMSWWNVLLFLIPIIGFIVHIVLWAKICSVRGKGIISILGVIFLPVIFIPYLAFSE